MQLFRYFHPPQAQDIHSQSPPVVQNAPIIWKVARHQIIWKPMIFNSLATVLNDEAIVTRRVFMVSDRPAHQGETQKRRTLAVRCTETFLLYAALTL